MQRENEIGFVVRRLSNLIKRDVEKSKFKLGLDPLSDVNGWAIGYFFDNQNQDIFQKDFENKFSIRPSTASNILKTMEQKGYIERVSVESDARLKKIVLTEKAINIHKSILKRINEREERLRTGLSPDEIDLFLKISDKLIENMEERND